MATGSIDTRPRCTGHTTSGRPCRGWQINGTTKCYKHGGGSLRGVAHPNYKHGRHTKLLPAKLRDRAVDALQDPDLLALREHIAVSDARIGQLYERLGTGESAAAWKGVRAAWERYARVRGTPDEAAALASVAAAIEAGTGDEDCWASIREEMECHRRLIESERRRMVELSQMITTPQMLVLIDRLVDCVRRHVQDRGVLLAISAEAQRLIALPEPIGDRDDSYPEGREPG